MTQWAGISFDFTGVSVLVTGGSNGIGLGIASAFKHAGADVTITGTRATAEEYDHDLSAFKYLCMQAGDNASVDAIAGQLDKLDILINNAGVSYPGGGDEWEPDVFAQSLQINLIAAFRLATNCQSLLAASTMPGGASVIGIASMTSFFGNTFVPGYGASKAGLVQLTKTLSMRWANDNIRVNAVAAGLTRSNMTGPVVNDMPELMQDTLRRTPQGRIGEPEDIAGPVLSLCSPAMSYVTGQTLAVDGGYSISGEP
jgi:NAD(P)-dependent dehydrogenase (short-subunit alcohol dehydrogenase family)